MFALQTRIFADHHQFYIHDSEYEHYDDSRLNWMDGEKLDYGYMATEQAIYIPTKASLNDHCVKIFIDETPIKSNYETCFTHNLEISSGTLLISSPSGEDEKDALKIDKGNYKITICGKNIGKDMFSFDENFNEEMSDEEYCNLDKFESYDIYIENT